MAVLESTADVAPRTSFRATLHALHAHQKACSERALFVSATDHGRIGRHVAMPAPYPLHLSPLSPRSVEFLAAPASADGQEPASAEMKNLSKSMEERVQEIQTQAGNEAQELAQEVHKDRNMESFKQKMEELKNKTKQHLDAMVDKSFGAAENLGERFPESQNYILSVTQKVTDFISGLLTSIVNFVTNLINNIANWVSEAWEKVKAFFTNSIDSARHFFASLF
jgi:ElaB/YqjD/DUF883 family membrane-anchored ribosome-binding protein